MSILLALIIFSVLIIFHELGHFLLARRGGIRVNEFSLGMGPKLVSWQRGETLYCLKLLPFGGSCMMEGEDGETVSSDSFGAKSVWTRISVVAAGPVFNFILAYLLAVILIGCAGYDDTVVDVSPGYPAAEAGIESGDRILSIGGSRTYLYREISLYSSLHQGESVRVTYRHDGETHTAELTPKQNESGYYLYGFVKSSYRAHGGVLRVLGYSAAEVRYWMKATIESLRMLIGGRVGLDDMSGPVGIVDTIGQTYEESRSDGWYYVMLNMIMLSILLSVNLGIMNLLPIPALDGGRLLFLLVEAVRGKAVPPEKEGMIHLAGFVLLMGLMVVMLFHDVYRIFTR